MRLLLKAASLGSTLEIRQLIIKFGQIFIPGKWHAHWDGIHQKQNYPALVFVFIHMEETSLGLF